jgi:hypothetical protein
MISNFIEDLNEWLNDQMKQLDQVYEQKLFELKQLHSEVKVKIKNFKQIQQIKINDIRRLFNSKLNKQINFEQLNRMKITVEQLRKDIHQFQTNQCSIALVNNDQINYSYKPNIDIQLKEKISEENQTIVNEDVHLECNKSNQSKLSANAKPFEFIPKEKNWNSISSIRQTDFDGRLFDGCPLIGSINKVI